MFSQNNVIKYYKVILVTFCKLGPFVTQTNIVYINEMQKVWVNLGQKAL
jgi:hypothetical protein